MHLPPGNAKMVRAWKWKARLKYAEAENRIDKRNSADMHYAEQPTHIRMHLRARRSRFLTLESTKQGWNIPRQKTETRNSSPDMHYTEQPNFILWHLRARRPGYLPIESTKQGWNIYTEAENRNETLFRWYALYVQNSQTTSWCTCVQEDQDISHLKVQSKVEIYQGKKQKREILLLICIIRNSQTTSVCTCAQEGHHLYVLRQKRKETAQNLLQSLKYLARAYFDWQVQVRPQLSRGNRSK